MSLPKPPPLEEDLIYGLHSRISFVDEILKLLLELRRNVYNAAGAVFELAQLHLSEKPTAFMG
jgi:hypothetical protein